MMPLILDTVKSGDGTERHYVTRVPSPDEIPAGMVLAHNQVRPTRRIGARGFRAWLQAPADTLEVCACGWAPEVPAHYRVRRAELGRAPAAR
jgi:hypothetical protein